MPSPVTRRTKLQFWQWFDAIQGDLFAIENKAFQEVNQPLAHILHPNTGPENTEGVP
jgi:hypothetical protein